MRKQDIEKILNAALIHAESHKTKMEYEKMKQANDILEEEVNHVRIGRVWFEYFCTAHGHDIESYWQALVREYFHGKLKRPFNHDDRFKAGMIRDWYEPLAD